MVSMKLTMGIGLFVLFCFVFILLAAEAVPALLVVPMKCIYESKSRTLYFSPFPIPSCWLDLITQASHSKHCCCIPPGSLKSTCVPMGCSPLFSVTRTPSACLQLSHITLWNLSASSIKGYHSILFNSESQSPGKHSMRFPSLYFQVCVNDNGPMDPEGIILKSASGDTLPS